MQRPTSVTVFGILNILFAAFGVVGVLGSLAMFFATDTSNNPTLRIIRESPAYATWLRVAIPLGLLGCLVLLAAGIGLLALRGWARKASIGYAIYALFLGLVSLVINFTFLVRPLLAEAAQKQGPEATGAVGGAIGALLGGCFGLAYPVLLLIFMTRPKVAAAFQPPSLPQPMPPG